VAYDVLQDSNPDLVTKAEGILAMLAQFTTLEDQHPFVECATFPDKIKAKGWHTQAHWHFIDTPFFDNFEKDDWYPNEFNITWVIPELKYALKYAKPDNIEPTTKSGSVSRGLGDSFNLRLLIHYVGDVH